MLLTGLPPLLKVNVRGIECRSVARGWVRDALTEARSPRPGGEGVLSKLAEVLFIEVLSPSYRTLNGHRGQPAPGGLRACAIDSSAARCPCMHKNPARAWTLEELARVALGTSRSVLAERFQKRLVGTSPMQHLTQPRMLLAANLLGEDQCDAFAHCAGRGLSYRYGVQQGIPPRVRHAARRMAPQPGIAGTRPAQ